METRLLVTKNTLMIGIVALCLLVINPIQAKERHDIRFYKINKDGITQKLRFTERKARKLGCHNFIHKARLHRTVQFGYEVCRVYAKKGCNTDSVMSFYRDKEPEPVSELTQGFGWYPVGEHERGEKVASWFCE